MKCESSWIVNAVRSLLALSCFYIKCCSGRIQAINVRNDVRKDKAHKDVNHSSIES